MKSCCCPKRTRASSPGDAPRARRRTRTRTRCVPQLLVLNPPLCLPRAHPDGWWSAVSLHSTAPAAAPASCTARWSASPARPSPRRPRDPPSFRLMRVCTMHLCAFLVYLSGAVLSAAINMTNSDLPYSETVLQQFRLMIGSIGSTLTHGQYVLHNVCTTNTLRARAPLVHLAQHLTEARDL